jgi:hypothetical protein
MIPSDQKENAQGDTQKRMNRFRANWNVGGRHGLA